MNSHTYIYDYLDGNAAAGELSNIFTMDVTAAEGQCAHCGATKRLDRKSTRLNSSHSGESRMPSSA